MRRTRANRLLFAGLVITLGVLVAAPLPMVDLARLELLVREHIGYVDSAIAVGLIAVVVVMDRVRWLPDPCLPPFRGEEPHVKREVAATSNG